MAIIEIQIRKATIHDCKVITELFRNSIQTICKNDYSEEQIRVWIESASDYSIWETKIENDYFIVAELNSDIVGFASLEINGCLDLLYVHPDYHSIGVASELIKSIEKEAYKREIYSIWTDSSLTAKPFFFKNNFRIEKEYEKIYRGVSFLNTLLSKNLK